MLNENTPLSKIGQIGFEKQMIRSKNDILAILSQNKLICFENIFFLHKNETFSAAGHDTYQIRKKRSFLIKKTMVCAIS